MNRLMGMLGLCARAGALVSGEKISLKTIRSGRARVVLLDQAAAPNAEKALSDACAHHGVKLLRVQEGRLGEVIGKPGRMVVCVTDPGFAGQILRLAEEG